MTREFARKLRRDLTDAERCLWRALRGRRFADEKFRRQVPIGGYIADFLTRRSRLIIELDGGQHAAPEGREHDEERTRRLTSLGYRVIRFWNHDVLTETEAVLEAILNAMAPPGAPYPRRDE